MVGVAAYKGFHRCPVLVCPKGKVEGTSAGCISIPLRKFKNHPDALEEGRIFDCETDLVVCSMVHGMGLAYSLDFR